MLHYNSRDFRLYRLRVMSVLNRLFPLLFLTLISGLPVHAAAPPDVVVSVKPLHSLVAGVMRGVGVPHLLVRGAANPHAYALRPSDASALDGAELVVWAGPMLETFLERPLAALSGKAMVLTLMRADGVRLLPARAGGAWEPHDHHHDPITMVAAVTPMDGHLWLDPSNARTITMLVADRLITLDPGRAAQYRANATAQIAMLDALDRELSAALAPVRHQPYIVFHDAYHYLEDHYGLNVAGAITVSPDQPPGAARLSALRRRIAGAGVTCVFAEPQFQPALVRTLTAGTDVRTGTLDPEGAGLTDGPELYPALMRFNVRSLVDCLSGG